jgi:PAS domain S-box-containing protein
MQEFLLNMFQQRPFMPHGHCYLWEPDILWAQVFSNAIIGIAYCSIPISLFYIFRRRNDVKFIWMMILFAIFILGCGITHIFDVIVIWNPLYRIDSLFRVITAFASIGTAVVLVRITPDIIKIPTAEEWRKVNEALQIKQSELETANLALVQKNEELISTNQKLLESNIQLMESTRMLEESNEELEAVQEQLQELNQELENRVEERTRELQDMNDRFNLLASATNDAIWERYLPGEELWVNDAFRKHFGVNATGTLDVATWLNKIHPEDLDEVNEVMSNVLQKKLNNWSLQFRYEKVDGSFADVFGRGLALYSNNTPYRMIGSMVDISEIKDYEKELEDRNSQLEIINRDLDNFVYLASHDLKSPITNLEGLLAAVRQKYSNQNEDDDILLTMIEKSIKRLKITIEGLAEIAKAQKPEDLDQEPLYFEKIYQEVMEDLQNYTRGSAFSIVTNFEVDSLLYSKVNLKSIFFNLLSNAFKYAAMDRPLMVKINTHRLNGKIVMEVEDNGIGLNPSQQEKLFTMFRRLHQQGEGTGIGLYITKRIVINHGGNIEVISQEKKGTTFRIIF